MASYHDHISRISPVYLDGPGGWQLGAAAELLLRHRHGTRRRSGFTTIIRKLHPVFPMKDIPRTEVNSLAFSASPPTLPVCHTHRQLQAGREGQEGGEREADSLRWLTMTVVGAKHTARESTSTLNRVSSREHNKSTTTTSANHQFSRQVGVGLVVTVRSIILLIEYTTRTI